MRVPCTFIFGAFILAAANPALTLGAGAPPASAGLVGPKEPEEQGLARRKVLHLKLRGELDCIKVVGELERALDRARADGVDVAVLEIGGDQWRADVLLGAMKLLKTERPKVVAWLNDPSDHRVGTGQAALALMASRCYLAPKTEVVFDGSEALRAGAPALTEWEQIDRDIQALLWGSLKERGRELLMAAMLPAPSQPLWAMFDRSPTSGPGAKLQKLMMTEPSSAESTRCIAITSGSADRGSIRVKIDTELALALKLADGSTREVGQLLAAERLSPQPLIRAEVVSGFPDARERLVRSLAAVDAAIERLDKTLDESEKLKGSDVVRRKRQAVPTSVPLADEAMKCLLDAEKLTVEYPELLRSPPPGATVVELTPHRLSAAWFYAFQDRRESVTELRARAARLSE